MPDIKWHEPHASAPPCPLVTMDGAGGWSFGSQSGGAIRLSISSGVKVLSLPASFFGPGSGASDPCCTGNAHAGSFGGGVRSCSGLTACCAEYTPADTNSNTPTNANLRIALSPCGGSKGPALHNRLASIWRVRKDPPYTTNWCPSGGSKGPRPP